MKNRISDLQWIREGFFNNVHAGAPSCRLGLKRLKNIAHRDDIARSWELPSCDCITKTEGSVNKTKPIIPPVSSKNPFLPHWNKAIMFRRHSRCAHLSAVNWLINVNWTFSENYEPEKWGSYVWGVPPTCWEMKYFPPNWTFAWVKYIIMQSTCEMIRTLISYSQVDVWWSSCTTKRLWKYCANSNYSQKSAGVCWSWTMTRGFKIFWEQDSARQRHDSIRIHPCESVTSVADRVTKRVDLNNPLKRKM